jgi:fructose-bisphosphate aldolase, class II
MSLVNLTSVLAKAEKGKYAVGNFDIFNIEMLKGVLDAAEETRSPIILAYGEAFEELTTIESFAPMMVELAQKATVPVCIHLDHCINLPYILLAVHSGFTSIMIDASDKPLQENIDITKRIVEICKTFNISVEAELGHVSGIEGLYVSDNHMYTDVNEAKYFVEETGIDALAISIGTVHGVYKEEPKLSLDVLKAIKKEVKQYLVLHGGSGLSDQDFKNTIKYGITKVNIHTDLTLAALDSIRKNAADTSLSYMKQCLRMAEAVKLDAIKKMEIFGSCGKAG